MNKKELSKLYNINIEIKNLEERLETLKSIYIGSSKISDMPHSKTPGNPVEKRILLISNLNDLLEEKKNRALEEQFKIEKYISTIEDIEIRNIFSKRYLQFEKWEKIAEEMNMCERNIHRKHSSYLKREI